MGTCTLTGPALIAESRRLAIPGRSRMSADELRTAISRETCPVTGDADCTDRACELHYMRAPIRFAPWTSPRGKHKRPNLRHRSA